MPARQSLGMIACDITSGPQRVLRAMTTLTDFNDSLAGSQPPGGLSPALTALWWAHRGEWDRAHACVQADEGTPDTDWVHAHLHRQEGDLANAAHWYRAAGRAMTSVPLADEWTGIAAALLPGR